MFNIKRLISGIAAICMFMSFFPTVSFADNQKVSEWLIDSRNGAKGSMELDTNIRYGGNASLKLVQTTKNTPSVYRKLYQYVPVKSGKSYIVSLMARAEQAELINVSFNWGARTSLLPFGGTYEWRNFEFKYTHTGESGSIEMQFLFDGKTNGFWLDNIEMHEINEDGTINKENVIKNGDFEADFAALGNNSGDASFDKIEYKKNVLDSTAGYYPLYPAKNIKIDAEDDEWNDYPLLNVPTDASQVFYIDKNAAIDLKMKFKAAYDDEYIYQWVDVEDDEHVVVDDAGTYWTADSVQVALSNLDETFGKELGIIHNEETKKGSIFNTSQKYLIKTKRENGHTIYEMAIPWKCHFKTEIPDRFKYCIAVNENDGNGRVGAIQLAPGLIEGKVSDKFPIFEVMKSVAEWRPWITVDSVDDKTGTVTYKLNVLNNGAAKTISYKTENAEGSINVDEYSTAGAKVKVIYETPGKKTITADFIYNSEKVSTDCTVTLLPSLNYTEGLREDLKNKCKELEELMVKCSAKGISFDYEKMRYRIINDFIEYMGDDENQNNYTYIIYYYEKCEKLYSDAKTALENYLSGKEKPKEVPKYVTSDITTDGTLMYANTELGGKYEKRPIFFIGYGHFEKARSKIPTFQDYGANTIQNEVGPTAIIKDYLYWSGYNAGGKANAKYEYSKEEKRSGNNSLKFVFDDDNGPGKYVTVEQTIDVKPNTTYDFGVFAKGNNVSKATITLADWGVRCEVPGGTYDWTEVSSSYTTGDTNKATFRIIVEGRTDSLYLDDFYVKESGADENIINNGDLENIESEKYFYTDPEGAKWVCKMLEEAEINNIAVNLLISPHYFPQFVYSRFPETRGKPSNWNIKNERVREVIKAYLEVLIPMVKDYKSLATICLTNEPVERSAYYGDLYLPYYVEFLKGKYGTIENANLAYNADYKDFSEVPFAKYTDYNRENTPEFRDYWEFNNMVHADFQKFIGDTIKSIAPDIPLQIKKMWYLSSIDDVNESFRWMCGTNHRLFSEVEDWNGNDCSLWLLEVQSGVKGPLSKSLFYDYEVGINNAPVVNSEDHFIEDGNQDFSDNQYYYTGTDMWMSCFHGRTMAQLWLWERAYEGAAKNSISFRPDCIEAVGTASMDINRLAKEAEAVIKTKQDFAVLYSDTARNYSRDHLNTVYKAYESLYFSGNKAHVLPEERLNQVFDYKALIIPNVRNISRDNLEIIKDYIAKGGKVLLFGNDNLSKDEYNKPIEKNLTDDIYSKSERFETESEGILVSKPADIEIRDYFYEYAKKLGGSQVELVDPESGKRLDNTEFEYGVLGENIIINCCNYEFKAPKKFKVLINGVEQTEMTELRSLEKIEGGVVDLKPWLPVMLRVDGAAKQLK